MNKSSNPNRVRRIATTAAGFVISVIGICAVAPSAFAMRVVSPEGTAPAVHHSGTPAWEIALIVVAVAVIGLGLLATIARRTASKRQDTALAGRRRFYRLVERRRRLTAPSRTQIAHQGLDERPKEALLASSGAFAVGPTGIWSGSYWPL